MSEASDHQTHASGEEQNWMGPLSFQYVTYRSRQPPGTDAQSSTLKGRTAFRTIIHLLVGQEEKNFSAHADILIHYSSFFKAALDKLWRESTTMTVKLPEDRSETVHAYLCWAYTGELESAITDNGEVNVLRLVELYLFADKVGTKVCKERIIYHIHEDMLHAGRTIFIDDRLLDVLLDWTTEVHGLRRLIIDFISQSSSSMPIHDLIHKAPDVAVSFVKRLIELDGTVDKYHGRVQTLACSYLEPPKTPQKRQARLMRERSPSW